MEFRSSWSLHPLHILTLQVFDDQLSLKWTRVVFHKNEPTVFLKSLDRAIRFHPNISEQSSYFPKGLAALCHPSPATCWLRA
ncbi:hypothetical protein TNCV_2866141 [Trichonephila clavipes]|nr:hypothetical protein TNCV_2866141 [Trichonephila clavipes]